MVLLVLLIKITWDSIISMPGTFMWGSKYQWYCGRGFLHEEKSESTVPGCCENIEEKCRGKGKVGRHECCFKKRSQFIIKWTLNT